MVHSLIMPLSLHLPTTTTSMDTMIRLLVTIKILHIPRFLGIRPVLRLVMRTLMVVLLCDDASGLDAMNKCLSLKTICCGFKFGNQFLHIKLGIRLSSMISFRLCKSESFVHWIQLIFLSVLFFYFCDFFFQFVLLSYNLMQKHGFPTTYDWNTILYNVKNTQFAIAINYGFQTMGS